MGPSERVGEKVSVAHKYELISKSKSHLVGESVIKGERLNECVYCTKNKLPADRAGINSAGRVPRPAGEYRDGCFARRLLNSLITG